MINPPLALSPRQREETTTFGRPEPFLGVRNLQATQLLLFGSSARGVLRPYPGPADLTYHQPRREEAEIWLSPENPTLGNRSLRQGPVSRGPVSQAGTGSRTRNPLCPNGRLSGTGLPELGPVPHCENALGGLLQRMKKLRGLSAK
uniref:Uncharacterized protein n=1 Tax=Ananas comosus var. bracteatus TaxID=296719 RepID=A0A6V7PEP3_ANACO|nr:unnamed protein product [Ananas comosus var. bracteatus]